MYNKNYTVIQAVRCNTYCDFSTCGPRTSPKLRCGHLLKKKSARQYCRELVRVTLHVHPNIGQMNFTALSLYK